MHWRKLDFIHFVYAAGVLGPATCLLGMLTRAADPVWQRVGQWGFALGLVGSMIVVVGMIGYSLLMATDWGRRTFNQPHVAEMLDLLEHGTTDERMVGATLLGQFGDTRARPALQHAIHDGHHAVREAVADALYRMDGEAAVLALLHDPDALAQAAAVRVLLAHHTSLLGLFAIAERIPDDTIRAGAIRALQRQSRGAKGQRK